MTTKPIQPRGHRLTSGIAAVAAGLMAAIGLAAPASAAEPTVDVDRQGSLTVYKYDLEGMTPEEHDGTQLTPPPTGTPLAGAEFAVTPIQGLALDTNSGWQKAEDLIKVVGTNPSKAEVSAYLSANGLSWGTTTSKSTEIDANDNLAKATFDLPVAFYYVEEIAPPTGYRAVSPFFVSIPMTDPANADSWLYDVHVYPKDAAGGSKTPLDLDNPQVGDVLGWQIDANVPALAAGKQFEFFAIKDILDPKLDYVSTNVSYSGADPSHYTVTDLSGGPAGTNGEVLVKFTPAGLAHLQTIQGEKVTVTITTKVNAAGDIENKADVYDNDPGSWSSEGNIEIPPVVSKSALVDVLKVARGTTTPLAGATFELWWSKNASFDTSAKRVMDGANPAVATTGADGHARFTTPVRVSNFANGKAVEPGDDGYIYYFLKETKAPADYELLAEPWGFELRTDSPSYTDDSGVKVYTETVENVKKGAGLTLPFTGGTGTVLFVVAGALLLAGTAAMLVSYTRRRNQKI